MAVRDLSGGELALDIGTNNVPGGAYSIAFLLKRESLGNWQVLIGGANAGDALVWTLSFQGPFGGTGVNRMTIAANGGNSNSTFAVTTTSDYVIVAFTCDGGFGDMGRWHLWDGEEWTHEDGTEPGTALRPLPDIAGGSLLMGPVDPLAASVALGGFWHARLSDANVAALTEHLHVDDWVRHDVTPASIWLFTQASTATPVTDLLGSSDQTALTGTTVVDDDPPEWDLVASPLPLELGYRLSGGAANADPAASIGGEPSNSQVPAGLFDDASFAAAASGFIDYRQIYVHNDDARAAVVTAYVSQQLEAGRQIALGAAVEDPGTPVEEIADDATAPDGVAFSAPTDAASGIDLGTIESGESKGLWLRRTVDLGTAPDTTNPWQVAIEANEP